MICEPCKAQKHEDCPALANYHVASVPSPKSKHPDVTVDVLKYPTGLSQENERIQRSGLCPCHHKVPRSDIGTEFVQQIDAAEKALKALDRALPTQMGKGRQ